MDVSFILFVFIYFLLFFTLTFLFFFLIFFIFFNYFDNTFDDSPILPVEWSAAKEALEDGGDSIGHEGSSAGFCTDSDCTTPAGQLRQLKVGFSSADSEEKLNLIATKAQLLGENELEDDGVDAFLGDDSPIDRMFDSVQNKNPLENAERNHAYNTLVQVFGSDSMKTRLKNEIVDKYKDCLSQELSTKSALIEAFELDLAKPGTHLNSVNNQLESSLFKRMQL
jgi:hypothetical protein